MASTQFCAFWCPKCRRIRPNPDATAKDANGEWTRIVNAAAESVCEQCAATPDPGDPRSK